MSKFAGCDLEHLRRTLSPIEFRKELWEREVEKAAINASQHKDVVVREWHNTGGSILSAVKCLRELVPEFRPSAALAVVKKWVWE